MAIGVRLLVVLLLCAASIRAQTEPLQVGLLIFNSGSKKLTERTREQLAGLRLAMLAYPKHHVVLTAGIENEVSNSRIAVIKQYLVKEYRIDDRRLMYRSDYGAGEKDKDVVLFRLVRTVQIEEVRPCIPGPYPVKRSDE